MKYAFHFYADFDPCAGVISIVYESVQQIMFIYESRDDVQLVRYNKDDALNMDDSITVDEAEPDVSYGNWIKT